MENLQALNGRAGKCYKIALAIIEIGSDALILVHGRIAGIEHAWIVAYPAIRERHYTKKQALKMAELTGTCGPWL
jgi:hypothetical protein